MFCLELANYTVWTVLFAIQPAQSSFAYVKTSTDHAADDELVFTDANVDATGSVVCEIAPPRGVKTSFPFAVARIVTDGGDTVVGEAVLRVYQLCPLPNGRLCNSSYVHADTWSLTGTSGDAQRNITVTGDNFNALNSMTAVVDGGNNSFGLLQRIPSNDNTNAVFELPPGQESFYDEQEETHANSRSRQHWRSVSRNNSDCVILSTD